MEGGARRPVERFHFFQGPVVAPRIWRNPEGVGAKVEVITSLGRRVFKEVRSGGSYLSQSTRSLFFALAADEYLSEVRVQWPGREGQSWSFGAYRERLRLSEKD